MSAATRRAAAGVWAPLPPSVSPTATRDAAWRRDAGWGYGPLAVVEAPALTPSVAAVAGGGPDWRGRSPRTRTRAPIGDGPRRKIEPVAVKVDPGLLDDEDLMLLGGGV